MGNQASISSIKEDMTPVTFATNRYYTFIDSISTNRLKTIRSNRCRLDDYICYSFESLLDDCHTNDNEFKKFTNDDKRICISILIYYYWITIHGCPDPVNWNKLNKYHRSIAGAFQDKVSADQVVKKYISLEFRWNDLEYMKWDNDLWVPCQESSINCENFTRIIGSDPQIRTSSFRSVYTINVAREIGIYLDTLNDAASEFDKNKSHQMIKSTIQGEICFFDQKVRLIPFHNITADIYNSEYGNHEREHFFSHRLDINPNQDKSPLIEEYFDTLTCTRQYLADCIINLWCSKQDTITVISGPPSSGKNTLAKLIYELYKPFICFSGDYEHADKELIRACIYENDSILYNKEVIRFHHCRHLIVVSDIKYEAETLSGRKVKNIVLSKSIPKLKIRKDIITNISTNKQLGYVFGWILSKYRVEMLSPIKCKCVAQSCLDCINVNNDDQGCLISKINSAIVSKSIQEHTL